MAFLFVEVIILDRLHTVKKSIEFSDIIHNSNFFKNKSYVIYYINFPHYPQILINMLSFSFQQGC